MKELNQLTSICIRWMRIAPIFFMVFFGFSSCMKAERVSSDLNGPRGVNNLLLGIGIISFLNATNADQQTQFVALGGNGSSVSNFISIDGVAWEAIVMPTSSTNVGYTIHSVAYGNGIWVAVGEYDDGGTTACAVFSSEDGRNWIERSCPTGMNDTNHALADVAYGNHLFVASGRDYNNDDSVESMVSTDGITWSMGQVANGPTLQKLESIVYDAAVGGFFALSWSSNGPPANWGYKIYYSNNPKSNPWTDTGDLLVYGSGFYQSATLYNGAPGEILIIGFDAAGSDILVADVTEIGVGTTTTLSGATDTIAGPAYGNSSYLATQINNDSTDFQFETNNVISAFSSGSFSSMGYSMGLDQFVDSVIAPAYGSSGNIFVAPLIVWDNSSTNYHTIFYYYRDGGWHSGMVQNSDAGAPNALCVANAP